MEAAATFGCCWKVSKRAKPWEALTHKEKQVIDEKTDRKID